MSNDREEIKPCKSCRENARMFIESTGFLKKKLFRCGCSASDCNHSILWDGDTFKTPELAIKDWNKRMEEI